MSGYASLEFISAHQIYSHIPDFGQAGNQIEFVGYCEYKPKERTDTNVLKIIYLLGRYSFFPGIGTEPRKAWGR